MFCWIIMERNIQFCYIFFTKTCDLKYSGQVSGCLMHIKVNVLGIYLFKVNNRNSRTRCEICSKLTIKTPERRQWHLSGVVIVNFEHISHLLLVFLLLTLSRQISTGKFDLFWLSCGF